MGKKTDTSAAIAAQIETLQRRLAEVKRSEDEAADQELLRLVHKSRLRDEFIQIARDRIGSYPRQRGAPPTE